MAQPLTVSYIFNGVNGEKISLTVCKHRTPHLKTS